MSHGRRGLVGLLAAVGLAACTAPTSGTPTSGTAASSEPSPPSVASTTGSPTEPSSRSSTASGSSRSPSSATSLPSEITLAFAGDVHFEEYLRPMASRPGALGELRGTLGNADLSMVNLETAITERGTPIGKEFHFRAPASALDTVAGAGIDVVTMANNHGVDFGVVGLRDTLAAKRTSPIPIVGVGTDATEAYTPAEFIVGGVSIAVFGVDQVFDLTLARYSASVDSGGVASSSPVTRIAREVRAASREHDLVVVYLHWGFDYQECPDRYSVQTAAALERAGADVIVGSHSHRVDGSGWLGRAYVDYGLGNFVWWRSREPDSRSGVLTLTIDAERARTHAAVTRSRSVVERARWTPLLIGSDGIPRPPGVADRERLHNLWTQARGCTTLSAAPGT